MAPIAALMTGVRKPLAAAPGEHHDELPDLSKYGVRGGTRPQLGGRRAQGTSSCVPRYQAGAGQVAASGWGSLVRAARAAATSWRSARMYVEVVSACFCRVSGVGAGYGVASTHSA